MGDAGIYRERHRESSNAKPAGTLSRYSTNSHGFHRQKSIALSALAIVGNPLSSMLSTCAWAHPEVLRLRMPIFIISTQRRHAFAVVAVRPAERNSLTMTLPHFRLGAFHTPPGNHVSSSGNVRLAAPAGSWQPARHDDVPEPVSWAGEPRVRIRLPPAPSSSSGESGSRPNPLSQVENPGFPGGCAPHRPAQGRSG